MWRSIARTKGGAPQLGATGPGTAGPYGRWPEEPEDDEDGLDGGGQDDEQHDYKLPAATVAGTSTEGEPCPSL